MPQFSDEYQTPHDWQPYLNKTGELIPAHGVFQIRSSVVDPSGRFIPVAAKPDSLGAQFHHRVNWHQPVEDGKVGYMGLPVVQPMLVRWDGVLPAPAGGDAIGPIDRFDCRTHVGGFRVLRSGLPMSRVLCVFEPLLSATARLTEELVDAGRADANPFFGGVVEAGIDVEVEDVLGLAEPIPVDTNVRIQWDSSIRAWVVIAAACSTG